MSVESKNSLKTTQDSALIEEKKDAVIKKK